MKWNNEDDPRRYNRSARPSEPTHFLKPFTPVVEEALCGAAEPARATRDESRVTCIECRRRLGLTCPGCGHNMNPATGTCFYIGCAATCTTCGDDSHSPAEERT